MEMESAEPTETAKVGDGIDDRDAASATGVHFFGVTDGTLAVVAGSDSLISDLGLLPQMIAGS